MIGSTTSIFHNSVLLSSHLAQQQQAIEKLSVLSYNVLLPNSVDGWWTYKMYNPPLSEEYRYQSSWDYRRDLLKNRLKAINADVCCLQEVSPKSFDQDFRFMKDELGYDGVELFKKGRFRPATFWKTSKVQLTSPAVHKDRCLLTAFRPTNQQSSESSSNWYVCNCHLQAGKQGPRRVRQVHDAVKGVMTMARKQKEPEPEKNVKLIVCGDLNGGDACGAIRFLEDGYIDETFLEDGSPVSSGRKNLPLSIPLIDVATTVERDPPPPTLVVPELISNMMEEGTADDPVLCKDMLSRLERIYKRLATDGSLMCFTDVKDWLIAINREPNRGEEFREAAKQMGWIDPVQDYSSKAEQRTRISLPEGRSLTLDGFIEVYQKELQSGKFWGIAHDMAVLGDPLPDAGVFKARYDRIYCSDSLQIATVCDTTSEVACPNKNEPSDHLPIAAFFQA